MNSRRMFYPHQWMAIVIVSAGLIASSDAQIISNGSFEAEPVGTAVSITTSTMVDSTTFTDWRFFSVGAPPKDFSATLVANASDGNVAMRLDLTDNGSGGQDHGLDRYSTRIPVEYGTNYVFSFDAAWISGSINLLLVIEEFNSIGASLGQQHTFYSVFNPSYQTFTKNWTPSSASVASIYIRFMPQFSAGSSLSLLLDNIQLSEQEPPSTLILSSLLQTYDGQPQAATYSTTDPEGLTVGLTYDGLTNEPVNAGSYTVIGIINDPTYQGSATNTLTIQTSGAYNAWKREWFTASEQANPAISGPEVYYDNDDFNNWQEYIAVTDPKDGQAFPTVQEELTVADTFVLNWLSASNRTYSVHRTDDLTQPFLALQTNILWPQSSYTDQTAQAEGFYQLNVQLPPCSLPIHTNATENSEIIGSAHVIPRYFFGTNDCLNEGADALLTMGSEVIKIWYYNGGETPDIMYPWNSSWTTGATSLLDGLNNTHYTELFDKPFKTFVMNVASFVVSWNPYYWKDNITQAQIDQEEVEFYEFAKALLQMYAGTGKTFILQHHEGDWHTRGDTVASIPAAAGVHERMVKWLNARQRGVTRAREEICAQDVFVYHAAEINIVVNAMNDGQPNMVNEVLPYTDLDLVSYSCYDSSINPALTGNPEELRNAVQYIKLNMPDSAAFGNDNVYLGEYGVPENSYNSTQIEMVMTNTVTIGLEENSPYILYWQLYDNELVNPSTPLPVTSNSDVRGFWLIKPDGTKSWHYDYLQSVINN